MVSQKIGSFAFLAGFLIAVLAGLIQFIDYFMNTTFMVGAVGWVAIILVVLGLIVGFLNIHEKKVSDFLIAIIAIAMIGLIALSPIAMVVDPVVILINIIVGNIVTFVAPAALVVGLKQIISLAKEQVV